MSRLISVAFGLLALAGVASAEGTGHSHSDGDAAAMQGESYQLGALTLVAPFARATLPNAPVAGGFVTVTNTGTEDDLLIGAASEAAGHMEVHEMVMDGEVMKMRELVDGLPIPAGQTVELKPGGFHIMFMDLKHPLVEGETVDVTLTFERAGEIEIPLVIAARDAKAGHGNHDVMETQP